MSEQVAQRPAGETIPARPAPAPPAPSTAPPSAPRPHRRLTGLDAVRALASCLVFYTHIATWYRHREHPLPVSSVIDRYVIDPMQLNKDLSFFGVALFFLVSGFVMGHVATRERTLEFGVKRILRIFPALVFAVLLAWVLVNAGLYAIPGGFTEVGRRDLLANMTLVNFFREPFVPLVGVAWTLVPQLAIYLMIGLLLVLFRRAPWLAIAIQITVCSIVLSIIPNFKGVAPSSIATIGAFGTAIVLGEVVWLVWAKRAPLWTGALLGIACWVIFCWGDRLGYGRYDDSYPLTLVVALLLVIAAVLASDRLPTFRLVSYLSSRSYSIYLVHQTIAFTLLTKIWADTWSIVAVAASIAAVLITAELLYRLVETPSARLAGRLAKRIAPRSGQARA